jgi:rhodanese-related sulfurtransferase
VARQLRQAGWSGARALIGGWRAWVDAAMPIEPKPKMAIAEEH